MMVRRSLHAYYESAPMGANNNQLLDCLQPLRDVDIGDVTELRKSFLAKRFDYAFKRLTVAFAHICTLRSRVVGDTVTPSVDAPTLRPGPHVWVIDAHHR